MPQRDIYHAAVRQASINDGWTITHDPYYLEFGERYGYVDLAAEHLLGAERGSRRIAVEVKSFVGPSPTTDLADAIGQYLMYKSWLARVESDRELYLAVDADTGHDIFGDIAATVLLDDYAIRLLVVDVDQERISTWRS